MHRTMDSAICSTLTYQMELRAACVCFRYSMVDVTDGTEHLSTFLLGLLVLRVFVYQQPDSFPCQSHPSGPSTHAAWVTSTYNAMVAFGCCDVTILDFEGLINSFLDFTSFQI